MNGYEFVAYGAATVVAGLAVVAIVPNPFRQSLRDTVAIWFGKGINSTTTEIERAERRVAVLAATIKEQERHCSDLRGTLNHEKNKLVTAQGELKKAEADYDLAKEAKLGDAAEKDCLDKIGAAEDAMHVQEGVVADIQKSVDVSRLAVAKAAGELQKLQNTVKSAAAKAVATSAINNASDVLQATKDLSKATSDIGKDLDKIDEKYEQAKTRMEDAQGSETDRKLEEARRSKERDDIKKRMEERRNAENGKPADAAK
jgi:chromosome segregation ATPase